MIVLLLAPLAAIAQTTTPGDDYTPPPMVPATPEPMTQPPQPAAQPGTPLPPGAYVPGQSPGSGYSYSPYGQGRAAAKNTPPPPEVGLMVSELLFGMLSAAGPTVLPFILLNLNGPLDQTLSTILTIGLFSLAPVVVAQTMNGIANGSAYYKSEAWIPLLVGLVGQALVLTTYYFANNNSFVPPPFLVSTGAAPPDVGGIVWLFIGTIGVVPILQMTAINLFKQPKQSLFGRLGAPPDKNGFSIGLPTPAPVISQTSAGIAVGAQLHVLRGTW